MNTPKNLRSLPRFSQWSNGALAGVLLLAAAVPYLNSLRNGFVYDDLTQILRNPYIYRFSHLKQVFTTGSWSYLGQAGLTNYYRPLLTFAYLLSYHAFGKVAFGYHLVNLVMNAAVVLVLFWLALALFRRRSVAFLAALIFALEPVHSEAVAWIAGLTGLEVSLFCALAFLCFVKASRPQGARSEGMIAGMAVFYALALLSKEQALCLPLLATIYEHAYREDRRSTNWRQKIARYGALWLLAGAYLLIRIRALGAFAPLDYASRLTRGQALLSGFALTGHYLEKIFWPWNLCAFYVFNKSSSFFDPRVLGGVAAVAALAAAFWFLWSRYRTASFGIVWFAVMLAPVLNARWMAANVFAERYLYLPSMGFCWAVVPCAIALWHAASSRQKVLPNAIAWSIAALIVLAAVRIAVRNRDWNNNVRLYTVTLAQQPDAYPMLNNLGNEYWERGEFEMAKREWDQAYRVRPNLAPLLSNLGLYYSKKGDDSRALAYYRRAMRARPDFSASHEDAGLVYMKTDQLPQAELQLGMAVALAPLDANAHLELGRAYLRQNRAKLALVQFRSSIKSRPTAEAWDDLGKTYAILGQTDDAGRAFEKAIVLRPFDHVAHFGLGAIYLRAGKRRDAERQYQAGLVTDPKDAGALDALKELRLEGDSSKHDH